MPRTPISSDMKTSIPFDNSYAALPDRFYARLDPTPVAAPDMIAFNTDLAAILGISQGDVADIASVFAGNTVPDGATPLAQLYAGHQFGQFNPQLGDGRAILLGEVVGTDGVRRDIQLKGSGPTPFSRMGDGRAWLGPVLREYVVSEAMHAMGVPTTRALAAVRTGDTVLRETPLPGAILTRVAQSHLRVGTFQVYAARRDIEGLQTLLDYAIARHYPDAAGPQEFLDAVIARQADLVAHWLSIGFIHGVMNTDNCTISGETIDYGPCAFMDTYHPQTVYSSIDRMGRYAYDNQADIVVWNMAQLATSLVQLMPDAETAVDAFTNSVHAMPDLIRQSWMKRFAAKIGITSPTPQDGELVTDLLARMADQQADFTNTFSALASGKARDQFTDPTAFDGWATSWQDRLKTAPDADAVMRAANPLVIPRNHLVENIIASATNGDDTQFHALLDATTHPFDVPNDPAFLRPPTATEVVQATFCGT